MMRTVIFFFTGTGNSLKIAQDLQNELGDTKLIQICRTNMALNAYEDAEAVGIVFPVYARGLPHMVRDFAETLQIANAKYIFAVANYGTYTALPFVQLNNILSSKGAGLSAAFGVPMPGNMWFMYYPHTKQDFIDRIDAQQAATLDIACQIKNRVRLDIGAVADRNKEEAIYQNFSPSAKDKDFWTNASCNGCGTCAKICPAANIEIVAKKPVWQHRCEFCLACIHWCSQTAIEYKQDSINRDRYHHPAIKVQELFLGPGGK